MSISRKTTKFFEFFQSVYVALLIKQYTYKVSTLRLHKQQKLLSCFNFSDQTQHALFTDGKNRGFSSKFVIKPECLHSENWASRPFF